ncbi:MAG: hypothetical protein GYB66_12540 [Chloroflexi bacterium]|nr:hypothetical protein [Chloroflexota bacterium]
MSVCLLLGFVALGPDITTGSPSRQDQRTPPRVIDTEPQAGEELPLDSPVRFFFDRPMNTAASAEYSVSPDPGEGDWSWEDTRTLVYTPPTEGFEADIQYTFSVNAEDSENTAMAEPFTLRLVGRGYLEVAEVLPADGSQNIGLNTTLTVVFNRPVVALVSISDQEQLPDPLQIDPPLEGEGEWLNTSIYLFEPDEGLTGGTTYTVTVPKGLKTASGSVLAQDYRYSFSTNPPNFADMRITNGVTVRRDEDPYPDLPYFNIPLEPNLEMVFTQPMDPDTETGIYLEGPDEERIALSYQWDEDRNTVTLVPRELLSLDTLYYLVGDEEILRSATGGVLPNGYRRPLLTVPYPEITVTYPENGEEDTEPTGGFSVYFNVPMDEETMEGKFTIEPEPEEELQGFYAGNNVYRLYFDTVPSAEYTITIAPGITDVYGNPIEQTTVIRYTTRAYQPMLQLNIPTLTGLYNAHSASTRLFVTHRNIDDIRLELYALDLPNLARLAETNYAQHAPEPDELLRVWQVPVVAPENIKRDKMLLISDEEPSRGTEDFWCRGAPPRRLSPTIEGRVLADDPRSLPVYAEAGLDSEEIARLAPGDVFWVQEGPVCQDEYLWWQVESLETEVSGWIPEGTTDTYFVEPLSDQAQIENGSYNKLPPGAYFLTASSPQIHTRSQYYESHVMIVATANITLKYGQKQTLAWVTHMETGEPIPGVRVRFYDDEFNLFAVINTDADGLAVAPVGNQRIRSSRIHAVLQDADHFGFVTSRFEYGIRPGQFGINMNYNTVAEDVYLYTDRPIYRPGQKVYFRGVLRNQDDVRFTPVPGVETVMIEVTDGRGQTVAELEADVTPFGTFSSEFELDQEASLGNYQLRARVSDEENARTHRLRFAVAEYRAPEFQVNVEPEMDEVLQGDTIRVMVEAEYFFGGGVSNADVSWTVLGRRYFFPYSGPGRWQFSDFDYDTGEGATRVATTQGWMEEIAEGEGTTNEAGQFLIEIPADLGERPGSQAFTIEARVTDETDQLVAGRATVVIHQGEVYVGMQPEQYIGQANRTSSVNVITVVWDSQPVPEQTIDYRVVERRWSSVQEEDTSGRTVWTWDIEEIEVASGTVITDGQGKSTIEYVPPKGGTYKIYATTVDAAGNTVNSSAFMWVTGREYVSWRMSNDNRIDLIADADGYQVGDTAQVLIPSPFQGETIALVTVERDSFLHTEVIRMENNSYVYELPIEPEYAPNIYISVVLIKGVDANTPHPEFRVGMIPLSVDTEQLAMNIEVTPVLPEGAEFAGPGDEVTLEVKTTDWQGEPVSAEVGIGVTDLAVLGLVPPNSSTLIAHYYSERGLSVQTATTLTISVEDYIQYLIDGRKGGGGGGGDMGIVEIRQDFVDTPLWAPSVVTDASGEAQATVTLPDNLTTWHVDARGVTTGADGPMLVGQTTADFLSTKPLLIRPVTPRFMVVGDQLNLGAVVNNNTDQDQQVEITMQGTGFMVQDDVPLTQIVTIPANQRIRVDWPVEVLDVPNIDVAFIVQNEDRSLSDASKPMVGIGDDRLLPVYKFVAPETVGTGGTLEGPQAASLTEIIYLPEDLDTTQGDLTIKLDRSLAGPTLDGLDYLKNYPHQCIEQTVSRFLPNVMTMRAFSLLEQSSPELEANLRVEVNFGLQRLYAQQKSDGGWGWFPADESNPLTTAYAVIGLVEARNSGFVVDGNVLQRAIDYLDDYISQGEDRIADSSSWQLNRRTFVLYALARAGRTHPPRLTVMFDLRHRLNLDAKAYLAMSMMASNRNDPRIDNLINEFTTAAIVSATGTHWEDRPDRYNWTTNTRTTALILMAMTHYDKSQALLPGAIRWLMVAREADAWETTQETAWAVMALTDWMVVTSELEAAYDFEVVLNQDLVSEGSATPDNVKETEELRIEIAELVEDEANRLVIGRTTGPGNLYYTAHLTTYLDVPSINAVSRGIIIERKYHRLNDEDETPITSARVGEQIRVTLNIIVPRNLHYVVIEDPIPAGAEAVDPRLLTSSIVGRRPSVNRINPYGYGWGWWWFSKTEFRDEKVVMYSTYLPPGTYTYSYTLRLGLAGEYNVIPTTGYEFYFPEVYGRSEGMLFTIEPDDSESGNTDD